MAVQMDHADLTEQIIGAYFEVYNTLGYGFLEKVYENAMMIALERRGLRVAQQWPINVVFGGRVVGQYFADIFVEGIVVVEIKAAEQICDHHKAQLLNYLKATGKEIGLLFNFGPEAKFCRKAMQKRPQPTTDPDNPAKS